MKKIISFLLITVMALTTLCACADNGQTGVGKTYTFAANGVEIRLGDEMAELLDSLGQWQGYDESPSCAFVGLDKVYKYSGFEIQTYPDGEFDYVYMITLTNDMVKTPEGISIGDSKSAVIAAYGDGYEAIGENLQYSADNCTLQFIFRDGKVSSIKYITTLV